MWQTARSRIARFQPVLEHLEDRCVPASISFRQGVLTITGDRRDDLVSVQRQADGALVVQQLRRTEPAPSLLLAAEAPAGERYTGVRRIVVDLGDGNDAFEYRQGGGYEVYGKAAQRLSEAPAPAPTLHVKTGRGDDMVGVSDLLGHVRIDTGSGHDAIWVGGLAREAKRAVAAEELRDERQSAFGQTVLASLDIETRDGDDRVEVVGVVVGALEETRRSRGDVDIDLGDGSDRLALGTPVEAPDRRELAAAVAREAVAAPAVEAVALRALAVEERVPVLIRGRLGIRGDRADLIQIHPEVRVEGKTAVKIRRSEELRPREELLKRQEAQVSLAIANQAPQSPLALLK